LLCHVEPDFSALPQMAGQMDGRIASSRACQSSIRSSGLRKNGSSSIARASVSLFPLLSSMLAVGFKTAGKNLEAPCSSKKLKFLSFASLGFDDSLGKQTFDGFFQLPEFLSREADFGERNSI
jgi:hypothetical protein